MLDILFIILALAAATSAPAQTATIKKVNARRLVHLGTNQTAHLTTGGKVSKDPFWGVASTEGEDWRAEVTYSNGILDGPVSVVKNNRLLYQFDYRRGVKILNPE
jgi:hypothetical protein